MDKVSNQSATETKIIDFGSVPVDTLIEKNIYIKNISNDFLTYRVSLLYKLNSVDHVFKIFITTTPVKPFANAEVTIIYKPNLPRQSFTEYYIVDDTAGNTYRLTVTGKCFVSVSTLRARSWYQVVECGWSLGVFLQVLDPNRVIKKVFNLDNGHQLLKQLPNTISKICRNISECRKETINIVNNSAIDATYQWLLPVAGQGFFQISTGNCGVVRAFESITATVHFTGKALGFYAGELVCLVLNQEPLFLNAIATVVLPGNPMFSIHNHVFEKNWKRKSRFAHLMENSLNRFPYIPPASVFERYLDLGVGSVSDNTLNISQTLCVTNHESEEGYISWLSDADNVFSIDPVAAIIPPNESIIFTVRFRPKIHNEIYGFLMCGEYQYKEYNENKSDVANIKHTWFRIPCVGNTLDPCTEWSTDWTCPTEIVLPPTVPLRTTFTNFMLSNKLECQMLFKFEAPQQTNFVVMPMCGIVQGRGWQIISVALEPKSSGDYYETWDLVINKVEKVRICLSGNAEISQVEVMSHGFNPATHAMFEFPPTITGCTNYCTAYLHNQTRMEIHMRVLNSVPWLGADDTGSIILPQREIIHFHWWFFPKTPDVVYETTVTCSCICLIDGKPVGEPTELFISILGFSELPDLRVLPKTTNLHDAVVGNSVTFSVTLYNYGSCFFTSKLYHITQGMGDDHSNEKFEIDSSVNSLKPSNHCEVKITVNPGGAGMRQVDVKYTVLFRTEYDEIEEIQPVKKTICIVWYDGIYPSLQVKRTICVKSPVILSNHCLWNMVNVDELNKALLDCRPNKPLSVNLYAPEFSVRTGHVKLIFVFGCVYAVPVPWTLRREKICDCEMIEVQIGISTYEMRHTCTHRSLVELSPQNGIVTPDRPGMLHIKLSYASEGVNTLCYVMTMPNQRTFYIYIHIRANLISKGLLLPLRRQTGEQYLAELECGRVPINNLDPVIRILWLYNPTDVYTTWRLLRGNSITPDTVIRCLIYFAEVPPSDKLAIPFAFMPTEMIDYEVVFYCSFGYDTVKILVKGQGGLPNCMETRLDMPNYVERIIRSAYKDEVVYVSREHITLRMMPTHSLSREIIAVCNDTDHVIRFIWLPERIANIINIVMTPWWGVVQPRCSEWITMTIYTLQEPATFTTAVTCEILDLTERRRYQKNELLRKNKTEKCNQEFIITEEGTFHPGINDFPPYVLDLKKPQPFYLVTSVSISSKGQRDGCSRMLLKQMWEQPPPYDLLSSDSNEYFSGKNSSGNNMPLTDVIRLIDGILWDALHSKMFRQQIEYYSKEEIPTYNQLLKRTEKDTRSKLSRRVTSGICDAIVNKAIFHVYNLKSKHEVSILEAE